MFECRNQFETSSCFNLGVQHAVGASKMHLAQSTSNMCFIHGNSACHCHLSGLDSIHSMILAGRGITADKAEPSQQTPASSSGATGTVKAAVSEAAKGKPQHDATAADHIPITPLQSDPSHHQHPSYTPSDSESSFQFDFTPNSTPASTVTKSGASKADTIEGARPYSLETRFDENRTRARSDDTPSMTQQQQPQLQLAVTKSVQAVVPGKSEAHLSPPQSCPSSPRSQSGQGNGQDSSYRSVTHVNSYFDKSDEEEQNSGSSCNSAADSSLDAEEEQQAESGHVNSSRQVHTDGDDGKLIAELKGQISTLRVQLDKQPQVLPSAQS